MTSPEIAISTFIPWIMGSGLCGLIIGAGLIWCLMIRQIHQAQTQRDSLQARLEERKQGENNVEQKLQAFADKALRTSQAQFLDMAGANLGERMKPVSETFEQFRKKIDAIERDRAEDRASMKEQIARTGQILQQAQSATNQLTNALSAPKSAGNWGEESLRNVLELSGASEFCDFEEQVQNKDAANKTQRPDCIMRTPGGRQIVIDAKVSLKAYLQASDASDAQIRANYLADHARSVRTHIQALGHKEYWKALDSAVDFVVMFIPGDHFWTAALEQDRTLFDAAASKQVLIVTPSTLIALAKSIAYGWRQETMAENAKIIARLGKDLHDRLQTFMGHIGTLGEQLSRSSQTYNKMLGSLEKRVLPQARKFAELGADFGASPLPDPDPIETLVQPPVMVSDTARLPLDGPHNKDSSA